jgi:hypothetical protein
MLKKNSEDETFLAFLRFSPVREKNSCWIWQGYTNRQGYGTFRDCGKKTRAHVYSYKHYKGDVPKGLNVLHSYDNPSCVNPDHLWLGSVKNNSDDMTAKCRSRHTLGRGSGRLRGGHKPTSVSKELAEEIRNFYRNTRIEKGLLSAILGIDRGTLRLILNKEGPYSQ